ncbi:BHLH domain-containing protein [Favolaschia claudopus]|uniref:BHLH domain-containing protein n=1 Tax=Favolaschia claudopus TaxID=2862362 RepID=A0AAW0DX14_9AGAR
MAAKQTAVLYAASVNPPRSAKSLRPRSPSESSSASEYMPEPRRVVPLSPKLAKAEPETSPGAKRGRKPATLSRTAREAQRKLNHSIIEKARRTKINDALATLKQLVPANYGQQPTPPADDDDNDGDYDGEKKPQKKGTGKREEKEKEFKLEILVRTVSFMQDLIERVATLEEQVNKSANCANCVEPSGISPSLKRKRPTEAGDEDTQTRKRREPLSVHCSPSVQPTHATASPSILPSPASYSGARLPSISSWLPEHRPSPRLSPDFQSHLPSPPSSTQFTPVRASSQAPPALNLGPIATQALLSARTAEDESAASLLLEISASSPTFQEPKKGLPRQIQTPSSLLGLIAR